MDLSSGVIFSYLPLPAGRTSVPLYSMPSIRLIALAVAIFQPMGDRGKATRLGSRLF
jgi:hypothetical protein